MAVLQETGRKDANIEDLRAAWNEMFHNVLPKAATEKSPAQSKWPVHVDHCFARIILDNTVGIDRPWVTKLKSPAFMHMSREQLKASIRLGEQILTGDVVLAELNEKSLDLRGKSRGGSGRPSKDGVETKGDASQKRKHENDEDLIVPSRKIRATEPMRIHPKTDIQSLSPLDTNRDKSSTSTLLATIAHSQQTPFQKRVLSALLQIPMGQYTTYGILAAHLHSSARAVGNGLRGNPFAPEVPCHRVLASGGGIGGFKGSWGRNGKEGLNDGEKRALLRGEGVKFDGVGKVVGRPWEGFQ